MRRLLLVVTVALSSAALPAAAEASCAPEKPKDRLARASAAFVGTVVERDGDRMTFAVEERFKGGLPDRVEVTDEIPNSSITLRPSVGDRLGLLLRPAGADGIQRANGCEVIAPEQLREAAAAGPGPCALPSQILAASRISGRRILLGAVLIDPDGELRSLTVRWGDGRSTTRRLEVGDRRRRVLRMSHRYRRAGPKRIRVTSVSVPGGGCGDGEERSTTSRVTVRPRR